MTALGDPNVGFYRNELPARPNGGTIEHILSKWDGNFELLERHHGYIQVLVPHQTPGRPRSSTHQRLTDASRARAHRSGSSPSSRTRA